jgi:hypothetical protein
MYHYSYNSSNHGDRYCIYIYICIYVYTASFNFHSSAFCPQSAFMYFIRFSQYTSIIYLNSINGMDFVMVTRFFNCDEKIF